MMTTSPTCRFLSLEEVQRIDLTARKILERVGMRVISNDFLDILKEAGAQVNYSDQIVRFEGGWLDEVLAGSPSQFILYSRDGKNDVHLGEGKVHFANGGRVFRILDMGTGGYRLTMLRDVAHTATLVDCLDHISLYIIACQAHDLQPQYYHLNDFYHALNHTSKHVMGGCDSREGAEQMWELSVFIAGGEESLKEKPFVSVITNPISPLTIDGSALNIMNFCCNKSIPLTCAPAPISGATAPATVAGTLCQMHAEALAGVAICQVLSPGAKVLYGAVPTSMDLRHMEYTMGSVEMAMMNAAAVQLAKLYELPIYASGGVTEAKRPDIQSGCEKTFSNLMVATNGADLVHLAAGISISYEQYFIDNEILGMINRILTGIKVDEELLALDVITNVGPGGNYIMEEHTIRHMKDEFFYPNLSVRCNFDIWEEQGRPSMLSRANNLVEKTLNDGKEGVLDTDLVVEIRKKFPGIQNH
jgi:trimethylamine--corrinoid protein Co-methyltransferase